MPYLRAIGTSIIRHLTESNAITTTNNNNVTTGNTVDDSNENGDQAFLIMLTVMVSCICLFFVICVYQVLRIWLCKRAPLGVPLEDTVLVHDGRIFNLTGDQRRAVLESIFSENSKSVTEQELAKNKKKRRLERKNRMEANNEVLEAEKEDDCTSTVDDDDVPNDVEIPAIGECLTHDSNGKNCSFGGSSQGVPSRVRKRTGSNDYNPSHDLDDDYDDDDEPIPVIDDSYLQEPPGDSPYQKQYDLATAKSREGDNSNNVVTIQKNSNLYENYDFGNDDDATDYDGQRKADSGCDSSDADDDDAIRKQLSYESCASGTRVKRHIIFRDHDTLQKQSQILFHSKTPKRRHSTGSSAQFATSSRRFTSINSLQHLNSLIGNRLLNKNESGVDGRRRTISSAGLLTTPTKNSSDTVRPTTPTSAPGNEILSSSNHQASTTMSTPRRNNLGLVSVPSDPNDEPASFVGTTPDVDIFPSLYYEMDDDTTANLAVPILVPSKLKPIKDQGEEIRLPPRLPMTMPFTRAITFPAYYIESDVIEYNDDSEHLQPTMDAALKFDDLKSSESTSSRKKRAKSYTIPENQPIVEDNFARASIVNFASSESEIAQASINEEDNDAVKSTERPELRHQPITPDSEESKEEIAPALATFDDAYGESFDEDEMVQNASKLKKPIPLQTRESFSTAASEYTFDDDSTTGENVCPICLCGYKKGDVLVVSKHCTHVFHKDCILEWLEKHDECPICRVSMITDKELSQAATSLVGKTRMYRAVASMQSSPTALQMRLRHQLQLQQQQQQNQQQQHQQQQNQQNSNYRTPPQSPYRNRMGNGRMGNRPRSNTASNGASEVTSPISPMHPSPLNGMIRR